MASYTFASQRDIQDVVSRVRDLLDTHTHERVNGFKVVVSDSEPTVNDTSIITLVLEEEE